MKKLIVWAAVAAVLTTLGFTAKARPVDFRSQPGKHAPARKTGRVQRGQKLSTYRANHATSLRSARSQRHTRVSRKLSGHGNSRTFKTASHAHPHKGFS